MNDEILKETINNLIVKYSTGAEQLVPETFRSLLLREQFLWGSLIIFMLIGLCFCFYKYKTNEKKYREVEVPEEGKMKYDLNYLPISKEELFSKNIDDEIELGVFTPGDRNFHSMKKPIMVTKREYLNYYDNKSINDERESLKGSFLFLKISMGILTGLTLAFTYKFAGTLFTYAWIMDYLREMIK